MMKLKNSTYKRIFLVFQALFLPPLFVYSVFIEPQWLKVRKIIITGDDNPVAKALSGVRVLHLSDLHINRMGRREYRTLELIDSLSPDIICVTGDYLDYSGHTRGALEFMDRLTAPGGVFGIFGNTDYVEPKNVDMLYQRYRPGQKPSQTLVMLRNETLLIRPSGVPLRVIGIDDPIIYKNREEYDKAIKPALDTITANTPTLLLAHRPDTCEIAERVGAELTLCGHTHGGQVRLPFSLQFYNQSQACKTYHRGLYRIGDIHHIHVSPGIGTSDIPMRFLSRPEMTLFTFSS